MNYRHIYHAGNFADIFKHLILIALLNALQKKDSPLCILDTHAGVGLYDLQHPHAQKTMEYLTGIVKWEQNENHYLSASVFNSILSAINSSQQIIHYPGSPLIVSKLLRPQDRLILAELHSEDIKELKKLFYGNKQVAVHHQDGYLAMKAFLPPPEKRGLIFIDPPFEQNDEEEKILKSLCHAHKHFRAGVYAIWYPIKKEMKFAQNINDFSKLSFEKMLQIEILLRPNDIAERFNGCGMLILNPPWQIEEEIEKILQHLTNTLALYDTLVISHIFTK